MAVDTHVSDSRSGMHAKARSALCKISNISMSTEKVDAEPLKMYSSLSLKYLYVNRKGRCGTFKYYSLSLKF